MEMTDIQNVVVNFNVDTVLINGKTIDQILEGIENIVQEEDLQEALKNYPTKEEMNTSLSGKSNVGHTHVSADVTDKIPNAESMDDDKLVTGAVVVDYVKNIFETGDAGPIVSADISDRITSVDNIGNDALVTGNVVKEYVSEVTSANDHTHVLEDITDFPGIIDDLPEGDPVQKYLASSSGDEIATFSFKGDNIEIAKKTAFVVGTDPEIIFGECAVGGGMPVDEERIAAYLCLSAFVQHQHVAQ